MLATALLLLVVMLAISVPVAAVMGVLGLALNQFFASMPLYRAMGDIIWNSSAEYILIAIPMFVMLGEVLLGQADGKMPALDQASERVTGQLVSLVDHVYWRLVQLVLVLVTAGVVGALGYRAIVRRIRYDS